MPSPFLSEPSTEVLGGPDMHVDRGSTINLTCVSKFSPKPPPDVIWYHNDKVRIGIGSLQRPVPKILTRACLNKN
jgi:hypothetical protein